MKSDFKLVQQALSGGGEAFAPIVDRYKHAVFSIAMSRLRRFHAAEDVAQTVFLTAFQQLGRLKDPRRLGGWLRSMAIRDCVDWQRRQHEAADVDQQEPPDNRDHGPGHELQRRELRDEVLAALGRLSLTQRETATLFYINGYSIAEVAGIQEIPVGTVKCRLHGAREKLKKELISMVEQTLKSESPKEDFARRVLGLVEALKAREIASRIPWDEVMAELRRIGPEGIEGYIQGLQSPHSPIRAGAAQFALMAENNQTREIVIRLLKDALRDQNKKVRRMGVDGLLRVDISPQRRAQELVPLVMEKLGDPAKVVRRRAAYLLSLYPVGVSLEAAVKAMLAEKDAVTQGFMRTMVWQVSRTQ